VTQRRRSLIVGLLALLARCLYTLVHPLIVTRGLLQGFRAKVTGAHNLVGMLAREGSDDLLFELGPLRFARQPLIDIALINRSVQRALDGA
jgi:hypothetical protein